MNTAWAIFRKEMRVYLVSPLATLNRGYAIAQDDSGAILRRADQRAPGDALHVRLGEGALDCRVESVKTDDETP